MIVDKSDVGRWFGEYLDAFAACGRGERDTAALLAYYGVPLLVTAPDDSSGTGQASRRRNAASPAAMAMTA